MPGKMARSDPRPSVRVTRGVGSGQHLASVLQEGWENANIDAGLGFHLENLGLNVFNAAKTLAQARGWKFDWRLVELPGVGHNARKMFSAPHASQALSP